MQELEQKKMHNLSLSTFKPSPFGRKQPHNSLGRSFYDTSLTQQDGISLSILNQRFRIKDRKGLSKELNDLVFQVHIKE